MQTRIRRAPPGVLISVGLAAPAGACRSIPTLEPQSDVAY